MADKASLRAQARVAVSFASQEVDSWAQKASESGQKRDKSGISRLAMCQSTKRACIDLNSRRMVGKSHHLLSSLLENAIQKLIRHLGRKEYVLQFMHTKFTNGNYLILLGFINSTT